MREIYKIDLKHQLRSFRECFKILAFCMVGVLIGYFFWPGENNVIEALVLGLLFWLVVAVVPALLFHLPYLSENWRTKLTIDKVAKTVEIEKDGIVHKYNFDELKTERHLLGHYRPDREKSYQPIPFDYYGYVKIKTTYKKSFIVTSLMTDPFDFPLTIDSTKYRFPFFEEEISEDEIKRRNKQYKEDKVNKFVETFDKLADENLNYKIENREKFERDAVEAAERIMEKRKKITTANKMHAQWWVLV
jgi:hypothetical protein